MRGGVVSLGAIPHSGFVQRRDRKLIPGADAVCVADASGSGEHIVHFARTFRLSFSNPPILNQTPCRVSLYR
jgi:hypothetical protein